MVPLPPYTADDLQPLSSFCVEQWVLEVLLEAATKNTVCGSQALTNKDNPTSFSSSVSLLPACFTHSFSFLVRDSQNSTSRALQRNSPFPQLHLSKDCARTHLISGLWDPDYSTCYVKFETISLDSITSPLVDSRFCVSIHPPQKNPLKKTQYIFHSQWSLLPV